MFRNLLLILILCGFLPAIGKDLTQPLSIQRVLVLQSYHKADWSDSVLAGIRSVTDTASIELYIEYMDTKKQEGAAYLDLLDTLFRFKYSSFRFDAILAVDDPAFQFVLQRGERIFGKIPMSFCGVNRFENQPWTLRPQTTGVIEQGDFRQNLILASKVRPLARKLWIIVDSTQTGLGNWKEFQEVLTGFSHLHDTTLYSPTLEELQQSLSNANPKDLGFFISLWKDRKGDVIHPDSLGKIFQHAKIPFFGRSEWLIGKGLTGGLCVSGVRQGAMAAFQLLSQLKSSQSVPVLMQSPNEYKYDFTLLRKHAIPMDSLPSESKIVNKPPTLIQVETDTFYLILIAASVIFLLVVLLFLSIHVRLRLSRKLAERESEFRFLIENQNDLVVKINADGRFLYASPAYCKFFHISEEDVLFQDFQPQVHPEDLPGTLQAMEALKQPPYQVYLEQRVLVQSGIRWMGWNDSAILDSHGEIASIIGVGRDITDKKMIEAEKENLIQELRKTNYELERFAYTVSHDLKSPLVTIQGFASELLHDIQNGKTNDLTFFTSKIQNAASHMSKLLDAILKLSRLGRTVSHPSQFAFFELVQEQLELMAITLRPIDVILPPEDQFPWLRTDRQRLQEVLQNLLENAVKYMGNQIQPQIQILVDRQADGIAIHIKDNGIGIERQHLNTVFGLFKKLHPRSEGIGFGLALSKNIVEQLGGTIQAHSDGLGKGSTFSIHFPYRMVL